MKRFKLLSLIAVTAVMFAGCEETYEGGGNNENGGSGGIFYNDCYCTISSDMAIVQLYTESEPTIVNFEGDCADATCQDLPAEWQELYPCEDVYDLGLTLTCESNY